MTKVRREILKAIELLSERYPSMRFGQLVVNISNWATRAPDATWDVEDEVFLAAAKRHLQRQGARQAAQITGRKARSGATHSATK